MNPEDGPDMVDSQYEQSGVQQGRGGEEGPPPGLNEVPPQHQQQEAAPHAPPLYQTLNAQIVANFHILIIVGLVIYFTARWVHSYWSNYYRPPPSNPSTMMRNLEAMQEARKRQAEAAKVAMAADAQKEKERRERALEEQRQSKDTRNGVYHDVPGATGQKLGSSASASAPAADEGTTTTNSDNAKEKKFKRVCGPDGCYLVDE